ncbi:hypothetical protein QMK19_21580 [Streptomyces sp. H10-C2]|uniref:hypothetical protein n=1 Tax=unclassified Streptomyces TaxID=2593676 RepID=UPI0024BA4EF4|nr:MULTISPECIES: hypothetical protein [unclassified Streptomyces]MDJ0342328.1 hypothetical protein [Streptomyces sp. PH10-H1]MDJ0372183.1 hypothetical protein [Streptomyces sp. H10-C2]
MNEDFIRELQQFQQNAQNLQNLMTDMQNRMPQGAEGTDAQGAISIRLAPDGLPEFIKAASDWQRRQAPEAIGAAVGEAYGAAMGEQMAAWGQAFEESNWQGEADQLDGPLGQPAASSASTVQPEVLDRDLRYVIPRPLDEVAEDVLSAFDAVERMEESVSEPAEIKGTSTARHVALIVSKGALRSCEVDRQWAARKSYIGLNQAFEQALADARDQLSRAESVAADDVAGLQLDSLLNEALAILVDPQHFAD